MKINKSLDIDLNIISPQKHIRIHEGDVDSVDILIGVSVDDESVDLTGVTIKYDATINNYLAEQDADGSVVDDKISIPVTQNMTAMSGLLLIDVRMIQNDQILFTQTICATVEKAVVNGSTYIDFDKITIIQRMNALEEKMDYIEELVETFDTSKLIVSVNRPPSGAPVEVDVDLLRVGDTWILSGDNIVYKLVEAQYNYSPAPGVEPRHSFTWQPLNERYGVGNTEPPTSGTYQAVVYTINEVQWSWLPVPEYFKGDHYQMQVGLEEPTYYICKSAALLSTGVCTYTWREEGGSVDAYTKAETNALLADKMDLAPLNPTAEEITAMPSGQIYDETDDKVVTIKGGTELLGVLTNTVNPEYGIEGRVGQIALYGGKFYQCFGRNGQDTKYVWKLISFAGSDVIKARATITGASGDYIISSSTTLQEVWELFTKYHCVKVALTNQYGVYTGQVCWITNVTGNNHEKLSAFMLPTPSSSSPVYQKIHFLEQNASSSSDTLRLVTKYVYPPYEDYYTAAEIDEKIGDIGSAIDTLNGNIDTLNTNLSEV